MRSFDLGRKIPMSICGEIENVEHEIKMLELKLKELKSRLKALQQV